MGVPGADFEIEIVLAIGRRGGLLFVCRRCVGILLGLWMQGLREESDGAEQEISADIFRCVHLILFISVRLAKLYAVRYPVLASKIAGCSARMAEIAPHSLKAVPRTPNSALPFDPAARDSQIQKQRQRLAV